jgi:two-component system LytT family sensor kinase
MRRQRSVVWWFQLYAWTVYGVGTYLSVLPQVGAGQWLPLIGIKVVRTGLGFSASLLLVRIYRHDRGRSIGAHAFVVLLSSYFLGTVWLVVFESAMALARGQSPAWVTMPRDSIDYALVLVAWSWGYLALRFWRIATEANGRVAMLELEALRYQLNPHFLFNALNSIRSSVPINGHVARAMIGELSRFLRHALESAPTALTPLREEIAAIRNYLAIEQRRFEDRLHVHVDVHPATETLLVPGLLLHPLVENAIKHGLPTQPIDGVPMALRIVTSQEPGAIAIEVANTGVLAPGTRVTPGLGIGLRNVRERLERFFADRASLDVRQDGHWVRARIVIRRAHA